jgi:hypothetical protein
MVDKYGSTHPPHDPQIWLKIVVSNGLDRNRVFGLPTVSI